MIVQPDGEECGCGQLGCLEQYASATNLARCARRRIERDGRASSLAAVLAEKGDLDAKDVSDAADGGDELALEVWEQSMRYLAIGCVRLARLFGPDRIVLGGGLARAGDHFRRLHWQLSPPRTQIALAELGNDAGVIGAAGVAWQRFGN